MNCGPLPVIRRSSIPNLAKWALVSTTHYYCCSECVGQTIGFYPITVMASRGQMPFSIPHENILANHGSWEVWNIMAKHGYFRGRTSILSTQWAWRALVLNIGCHAWPEERHLGSSKAGAYYKMRFVEFLKRSWSH